MNPTGQAKFQTVMHSHGQVAATGRWTSTWTALPAHGYLIQNAPTANHTVEPNLWANANVFSRIQCTTHAQTRARGHCIRDLLDVTTSHKGQVVTHQGCPRLDILCAASKKTRRLFRLPVHRGENFRGECGSGGMGQM